MFPRFGSAHADGRRLDYFIVHSGRLMLGKRREEKSGSTKGARKHHSSSLCSLLVKQPDSTDTIYFGHEV